MAKIMTTSPVFNFWVTFSSPKTDQKDEEETDLQKSLISDGGQISSVSWVGLGSTRLLWRHQLQQEEINRREG